MTGPRKPTPPRVRRSDQTDTYEIVVRGGVGPAMRSALLPVRALTERVVVTRVRLAPGHDVTDVVAAVLVNADRVRSVVAVS